MESREEDAALDLRAWHIRLEIDRFQMIRAHDRERRPSFVGGNPRAHPLERDDDPAHRPAAQRAVAREGRAERVRGENAGEHSHRAARIARVERGGGRMQATDLEAKDIELDAGLAGAFDLFDRHAHRTQAIQRRGAVGAGRVAMNHRRPVGNGRQHGIAVRDRLVAGWPDAAAHALRWLHGHGEGRGHETVIIPIRADDQRQHGPSRLP
jgi:hypothetical protein